MSKRRLSAVRILIVLSLALLALTVAFSAGGHDTRCPEGWEGPGLAPPGDKSDKNGNGLVCTKMVNGNGSTGTGINTRDDHEHHE